ncbi:MarR family transcriptional regulator [Natrinema sp. S1CR25-10]|uniref:MarR family transcriptional regulator n=2 Tax=Natrinema salsiterrestre TaxID=2950540 RepID=A0A9Q4Q4U6_9EURY|nr:MarR family transcriptional regulator [Natrinema salsiterrestre]
MTTPEREIVLPDDLGSPQVKLVYLALLAKTEATATELQQLLKLSKLTLLPILTSLVAKDLVRRTEGSYAIQ